MERPEKPLPYECCGSGCEWCVYDEYVKKLKQYRAWKQKEEESDS